MRPRGFGGARIQKPQNAAKSDQKKPIFEQFLAPSNPKTLGLHPKALKLSYDDHILPQGTNGHPGCGMLAKISSN